MAGERIGHNAHGKTGSPKSICFFTRYKAIGNFKKCKSLHSITAGSHTTKASTTRVHIDIPQRSDDHSGHRLRFICTSNSSQLVYLCLGHHPMREDKINPASAVGCFELAFTTSQEFHSFHIVLPDYIRPYSPSSVALLDAEGMHITVDLP